MRDKSLSIEAKAIYAYLASYSGHGMTSFPSVDLVCHELGISRHRFVKHRKMLEDSGYISVERITDKGKFKSNLYTINVVPTYQNPTSVNATSGKPTSGNDTTNNNSVTNNNLNNTNTTTPNPKGSGSGGEKIPAKAIHDLYNSLCPDLPRSMAMTPKRERQIKARWKEDISRQNIGWWEGFFKYVHNVPFLNGNNDRGWKADLEWITNPNNFVKVAEGKYQHD